MILDSSNIDLSNQVILYGQKPDDFHRLNKDAIFTMTAAALQEVDRQQQADKENISTLETEIATLKNELEEEKEKTSTLETEVTTLKTQMSELLERMNSLEAAT